MDNEYETNDDFITKEKLDLNNIDVEFVREEKPNWNRILIRDEFLKLYFDNLGMNDSLAIERLTNIHDVQNKQVNEKKVLFVIVETKYRDGIEIDKLKSENKSSFKFIYPYDDSEHDDSFNFLSLAFSGFSIVYDEEIKDLYMPNKLHKENSDSTLLNFIKNLDPSADDYENFSKFFHNSELKEKHNKIADEIFGNKLQSLPKLQRSYSLFFIKNNKLCEYHTDSGMVTISNKTVNENDFREELHNHIVSSNENSSKGYFYSDNLTTFAQSNAEKEDIIYTASNNIGEILLVLILTFLYILNYLIAFPGKRAFDLNKSVQRYFEYDDYNNNILDQISTLEEIKTYIFDKFLYSVYDPEFNSNIVEQINTDLQSTNINENIEFIDENLEIDPNNYYMQNKNYFSGVLINFERAKFETVTDSSGKPFIKRETKLDYYNSIPKQNEDVFLSFGSSEGIISYALFGLFYKSSFATNIINFYTQQLEPAFDTSLYSIYLSVFVYNSDYDVVSIYSINFTIDTFGMIKFKRELFNLNVNFSFKKYFTLLIINILYILFLLPFAFMVFKSFFNNLVELVKYRNYSFNWYDWIDMISLALSITSMILFYNLVLFHNKEFSIAISDVEDLNYWINHAVAIKEFNKISGFTMIFLMIRLVRFLFSAFPQMGIVFLTIKEANIEIISFLIILIVIMTGIFGMSHNVFGWYSDDFKNLSDSAISTILMFLGMVDYEGFANEQSSYLITPFFFIVFMIFFNLNLLNVFLCIIRNNYIEVKKQIETIILADSLIRSDDRRIFLNNVSNLILFKNPLEIEEEVKEDNKEGGIKENDSKNEEKTERKKINLGIWKKFKYNLSRLNILQYVFGNIRSREETIKKTYKKFQLIRKMKVNEYIQQVRLNYELEYDHVLDSICFILFIIIFVLMMMIQIKIGHSDSMQFYIDKIFASYPSLNKFESFDDVDTSVRYFLTTLYHNKTSYEENCLSDEEILLDPYKINNYVFLNPPYFRLAFRYLQYEESPFEWKNKYFPQYLKDPTPLTEDYCQSQSEFKSDIYIEDGSIIFEMPYTERGFNTANSCGGYIYLMNSTSPFCENNQNYKLISKYLFNENVGSVVFDTALFSLYFDFIVYYQVIGVKQSQGDLNFEIDIFSIPINRYKSKADFGRMIIEVLYLLFVFYFLVKVIKDISRLVANEINTDNERYKNQIEDQEEFEKFSKFDKFFRFKIKDFQKFKGISLICRLLFDLLTRIIGKLFKFIFILLGCILKFITQDYFNILNIVSIIISISMTFIWYNILINTINLNFDFSSEVDPNRIPNLFIIKQLERGYKTYIYFQSINGLLIFIRMIQFFKFSKSIYSLISVISKAASSIYYHLVFIFLINFGFSLCAYAIFGQYYDYFNSIVMSILSWTIFLAGRGTLATYNQIESGLLPIIVLVYNVINIFILCNILAAIIIESYRTIQDMQNQADEIEKHNFYDNLKKIIKEKKKLFWNTCSVYMKLLKKEEDEDNQDKHSQIQKLRKQFENDLNSLQNCNEEEKPSSWRLFKERNLLKRNFFNKLYKRIHEIESLSENNLIDFYVESDKIKNKNSENQINSLKTPFPNKKSTLKDKNYDNENYETGKITILVKIMTYVYILCGTKIELVKNVKSEEDKLVNTNFNEKKLKKNTNDENIKYKATLKDYQTEEAKAMKEFIHKFQEKISDNEKGFLKTNIFKKYYEYNNNHPLKILNTVLNPYRLSKESRQDFLIDYESIKYINKVSSETVYNIDFKFCIHNSNDFCHECKKFQIQLKNISSTVYDLMVKNFYKPRKLTKEEKELYLGYYFYIIENESKILKIDRNLFLKIESIKHENFFLEISYLRQTSFDDDNDITTIIKSIKRRMKKGSEIKVKISNESDNNEILELYKNYIIWNTIYIILFEKNKKFTRDLKLSSKSNEIYELHRNNPQNFYTNLFIELFQINDEQNQKYESENIISILKQSLMKKLNNYPELFTQNFSEDSIYSVPEKYLFDEDPFEMYKTHLPKEKIKQDILKEYPMVFIELWNSFSSIEKFNLFFGYNKVIHKFNKKFLMSDEFIEEFSNSSKTWEFFSASNQAQIFTFLKFSEKFLKVLQQEIKNLFNEGIIPEYKDVSDVVEVLRFFEFNTLNSLVIFKFFRNVFDKTLKNAKDVVITIDSDCKNNFKSFINKNSHISKEMEFKLCLAKFYQLGNNLRKFEKLKEFFEKEKEKDKKNEIKTTSNLENVMKIIKNKEKLNNIDQDKEIDKENEDDLDLNENPKNSFEENEIFIFALSLNSVQFMNIIQKIEDPHLKELYLYLFHYIHSDYEDYVQQRKHLKRKIKLTLIEKYEKYLSYILQKEKVNQKLDNFENERNILIKSEKQLEEDLERLAATEKIKKELLIKLTDKYNEEAVDDPIEKNK